MQTQLFFAVLRGPHSRQKLFRNYFLFHNRYRYREISFSNYFRYEFGQMVQIQIGNSFWLDFCSVLVLLCMWCSNCRYRVRSCINWVNFDGPTKGHECNTLWHDMITHKKWFWNSYFAIIPNFTRNSLKITTFPGDFEGVKLLKNSEK